MTAPKTSKSGSRKAFARPSFTLSVENFGPIAKGSVSTAPLVVLVGKNSTGKSYMASLLWGLMSADLLPISRRSFGPPKWLIERLEAVAAAGLPSDLKLDPKAVEEWLNAYLMINQRRDLSRLFSSDAITADHIHLSLDGVEPGGMRFSPWDHLDDDDDSDHAISTSRWEDGLLRFELRNDNVAYADVPFGSAVQHMLFGSRIFYDRTDCTYIPAARTGLILALDSLVETSLASSLGADALRSKTKLPLPTIRFLQQLSQRQVSPSQFSAVADFLEGQVLGGSISNSADEDPNATPAYFFETEASGRLPLFLTSSMVTELAPIAVLLRRTRSRYFVIEEPEAHLHLSAQRQMARGIVRLVNSGAQVVVTTHSDTFLQQLNLSLSLSGEGNDIAAAREELGYTEADIISPADVRCYEFAPGLNGTEIREATMSEDGFIVESINEPLYALTKEVLAVQEATGSD